MTSECFTLWVHVFPRQGHWCAPSPSPNPHICLCMRPEGSTSEINPLWLHCNLMFPVAATLLKGSSTIIVIDAVLLAFQRSRTAKVQCWLRWKQRSESFHLADCSTPHLFCSPSSCDGCAPSQGMQVVSEARTLSGQGKGRLWASLSGTFLQTLPDLVKPLKGHSLSLHSCPAMQSVPSERFGYW